MISTAVVKFDLAGRVPSELTCLSMKKKTKIEAEEQDMQTLL